MDCGIARLQDALASIESDRIGVAAVSDIAGSRLHDQVAALLPGAKSVVVLAMEVFSEILDHTRPDKTMGEASPRDMIGAHLDYLNGRLTKGVYDIARLSRSLGYKAIPMPAANVPTDQRYLHSILSYKHAAEAAGIGTIGRHSLLITPEFGPRVRLACLLTEAALSPAKRSSESFCDGCNRCIQACPAQALSEPEGDHPYAINRYACFAFRGGAGPCSECMRVCPVGR